jgi:hypothetical protein
MSRVKATLALLALASLGWTSLAGAQTKIELNPFAGYYVASDIYNTFAGTNGSNVELTNGLMWGGRLTASTPRGGIEFSYTRTGSDIKIHQQLPGQLTSDFGHIDFDNYDMNFLGYSPTGGRATPFGLIGFGWAVTHPDIDAGVLAGAGARQPKSNTLFNFNFGLGTKIEMSPKIGLRLEGRWRVTDTKLTTSSGIWCDAWGYCYSYASDWYNSGEFIGGITYALGEQ